MTDVQTTLSISRLILFNGTKKRVTVVGQVLEMIIPEIASHHCLFI